MPDAEIIPLQPRRPGRKPGHRRTPARTAPHGLSFTQAVESWELALNSRGRAAGTIRSYRDTIRAFTHWLSNRDRCICAGDPIEPCPVRPGGPPTGDVPTVELVDVEDVRLFLAHERLRTSAGNAEKQFRNLRALFRWLVKQGHVDAPGPVDNDDKPHTSRREFPPFTEAEIGKLLKTCKHGSTFEDLRDHAIMRLLLDIGPRVGGIAGVRYIPDDPDTHDLKLGQYRIRIRLKGGDEYIAPVGKKAASAIDKYIRRGRAHHPDADEPWLWLGRWGQFKESGIQQMLKRRGRQAQVDDVHPHRFRRTAATDCLEAGMSETDVMLNFGWKRPEMVRRYTEATAKERARRNHQRQAPADRY
ncbi:tyrosine-type recombinase/integrase [Actinomadura sp. GTD37]|uniref:tyrosine-type recombinase/integrase n=1 Tax=Actinomadura sp. GTD37 TaxID=1778030 RepID=UPI0035C1BED8